MEISLLSSLKHKNLVSLVGFCDKNDGKVIIYKFEFTGNLIHYLSDPSSILLNDDGEPKLCDFLRSMKIKASERHQSFNTDKVWSTDGTSVIANDTNKYLAPVAITHYTEKKLHEIIDWDLWKQMDSESFNIFAEMA
ncbi:kinase-like domain, phloem protein 2-like protein [Tanacetum coccineum]